MKTLIRKPETPYSEQRLVEIAFKIHAARTYLNKVAIDIGRIDNAMSAIDEFSDAFQLRNSLCQWRYDDLYDCHRIGCKPNESPRNVDDFKYCPYCGSAIKKC